MDTLFLHVQLAAVGENLPENLTKGIASAMISALFGQQPGAIIGWRRPSHVAVVEKVDGDRITFISGNMSNAVKRHPVTSGWGSNELPAFVRMPV